MSWMGLPVWFVGFRQHKMLVHAGLVGLALASDGVWVGWRTACCDTRSTKTSCRWAGCLGGAMDGWEPVSAL